MGVPGLLSFLIKRLKHEEKRREALGEKDHGWESLEGKHLLVDGSAFCLWLAGRAFERYHDVATTILRRFADGKVSLTFMFDERVRVRGEAGREAGREGEGEGREEEGDREECCCARRAGGRKRGRGRRGRRGQGGRETSKNDTDLDRLLQRRDTLVFLQEMLLQDRRTGGGGRSSSLPRPSLLFAQFQRALEDVGGMEVLRTRGEADRLLAEGVAAADSKYYAVLSNDSDFVVHAGCRLLTFDLLRLGTMQAGGGERAGFFFFASPGDDKKQRSRRQRQHPKPLP
ncbi:hypothetical protein NSK_007171 [Nannochloropsis salina CCMP1776]|uniref:XPG N-terminal domain-containing protein n=1 Tax=Nannochloropsis salina CCMP1776 TaxID=1027361 RepID=A0A4D9CQU9_9STRA|nr:hypothetical protein NSK_007171 [Nannochloropsis salina CCMP1776]|eukprot:TFJ81500.1 hypothetical protein NSK_007171 [Nannochloropsis salina CCMP1776]